MTLRTRMAVLGGLVVSAAAGLTTLYAQSRSGGDLGVAQYSSTGQLAFPAGTDRWIVLGTGLGGDYEDTTFDPANPGSLNVVKIEPKAYDYFLANGRYADGTMLLLTFYNTLPKPDPALRGFVQGDVALREIHVIDKARYTSEGHAFFSFPVGIEMAAAFGEGSECIACHSEHGAFDATFTQFYPTIRDLTAN
jgi:Cytochrome P460